jgi:hypothetical protein
MMKRTRRTTLPDANWAWTSPEEVLRHALASYYGACRYMARGHQVAPSPRAYPDEFIREVVGSFQLRMEASAHRAGIDGFQHSQKLSDDWFKPLPIEPEKPCGQLSHDIHCHS